MAENPIKYSDLFQDDGALDKLIKKIAELESVYKGLGGSIISQIKKIKSESEKLNVAEEKSTDEIAKKEKELEKLIKEYDKLMKIEKEVQETKKKASKLAKEEQRLLEKRNDLTQEAAVENAKLKLEIQELNKANKQQAREALGLVDAYEKQGKRLATLRRQYKNLVLEGKENTEQAQKLFIEVTKLDKELKDLDASVGQTGRNVGNYKESVKEALEETNLWGEGLTNAIDKSGVLGGVLQKLQTVIALLTKAKSADENQTKSNIAITRLQDKATKGATVTQRAFGRAQLFSARAARVLGKAFKATGIGLLIVALGGLVSLLSRTQNGIDGLSRVIETLEQTIQVLVRRLSFWGAALASFFTGIGQGIAEIITAIKNFEAPDFTESTNSFAEALENLKSVFSGILDELDRAFEQGKRISQLEAQRRKGAILLREEIAKLNAEAAKGEEIEGDNTKSFEERKEAILSASRAQEEASRKQVELIKGEIQVIEERQRLARESVKDQQQLETLLVSQREELSEKTVELIEAEGEAVIRQLAIRRVANQLEQDLIEKNLDILIDGFDNQKTINEQLIADEKRLFEARRETLKKTKKLRQEVFESEIAEIQKTTDEQINVLELQELLAEGDSIRLNEKIRLLGLSEILEGRLLEVLRENNTATNDLAVAEKELNESRIAFLKETITATEDLAIANERNVQKREQMQEDARVRREKAELETQIKIAEGDEELTKALIAKKEQLQIEADQKSADLRISSIEAQNERELKELEIGLLEQGEKSKDINAKISDERINQLEEEIQSRQALNLDAVDQELELARLKATREKEIEQEKYEELAQIRDAFVGGTIDAFIEENDKRSALLDEQVDNTQKSIDRQKTLAEDGVANTLAFEEAELAKLEQKKQQAEKERIRLEKVKALYSAYSAAASNNDEQAILKALRDLAILEGIAASVQGSFGEGTGEHGTIADALDVRQGGVKGGNVLSRGIFKGEKHAKKGFGIPVLVEGGEGILSTKQMNALGKDNFMQLTQALDSGVVGSNFFSDQIPMIPEVNSISIDLGGISAKLNDVERAIKEKPVQQVNVENLRESYMDIVDTTIKGKKKLISRYRVNKKRI